MTSNNKGEPYIYNDLHVYIRTIDLYKDLQNIHAWLKYCDRIYMCTSHPFFKMQFSNSGYMYITTCIFN